MIIPMYNKVKCVEKTLQSVVDNIHYDNFECIIVDDESTDGSSDIAIQFAKAYPDRFRYVRVLNGGVSRARNFGVQCTDAEYVCFLDADDEVYSDYVTRGVEVYDKYNIDLYIENAKISYPDKDELVDFFDKNEPKEIIMSGVQMIIEDIYTSFACGLYKRDMVKKYGFLDNIHLEDYVFVNRYKFYCKHVYINFNEYAMLYHIEYSERNKTHGLNGENEWLEYTINILNDITDNRYPILINYYTDENGISRWSCDVKTPYTRCLF